MQSLAAKIKLLATSYQQQWHVGSKTLLQHNSPVLAKLLANKGRHV